MKECCAKCKFFGICRPDGCSLFEPNPKEPEQPKQTILSIVDELDDLKRQIRDLGYQITTLCTERDELVKSCDKHIGEVKSLKADKLDSVAVTFLKQTNKEKEARIDELEGYVSDLKRQVLTMEAKFQVFNKAIQEL